MFNSKQKITGQAGAKNTKDFEIIVHLKYLSKSRRVLEML